MCVLKGNKMENNKSDKESPSIGNAWMYGLMFLLGAFAARYVCVNEVEIYMYVGRLLAL